ncbi:MarR family transcriptional regulator [Chitinimonas prasina]|uniref:MarR family transcriptional regulator n=1 Tax=Chitinimonas prasina TaxID=1434937 RepID=A0ABQ5YM42_9NEIS|nr:MarR family transcriptional regulator [Chitinimonas prasina]
MVLTILAGAVSVEFGFIEKLSGLSKGNLSSHMSKLEAGGLITIHKSFRGKRPLTTLAITAAGLTALSEYRQHLSRVIAEIPDRLHLKE